MRELKFRTPVICQNGHKAYWYWSISPTDICYIIEHGVPADKKCSCPKFNLGEGYYRNGHDEQYIGLKDKNGVEIYEGDILVHKDYYLKNAPQVKTVMEWHCDSASFTRFYPINEFIVIGNIYENHELLEN